MKKTGIVLRPIITEKTMTLASRSWFTFAVAPKADKAHIASEIHRLYNVKVLMVRTVHVTGKTRRAGRKGKEVTRSDWKKALVKLPKGERIAVFEVTQEAPTK